MATVQDLGKVAYFNKGVYNSETTYEINDVVSYDGSSYVSLVNNNRGNLPTNTAFWSIVASKGEKGDTGKPFVIEKTYESIEDMVDDYDNMNVNDYVMIQGNIEEEENATLWTKTDTEVSPYKWVYLADFSGASGITGATPNIQIGNVTEGNQPSVTRRAGSTNENPILDFVLKTGATGATGATGNGISGIEKTSTSGLTDIYTISYTSGNSSTFDVHNGKGISSIAKTSSVGLVDTYTITYNDGTTSTFEITNGEDGEVTQEQLDETNEEVERAEMVYNALPKVSGEGTDLTLDNTAECPVYDIKLRPSELEQETTTGKNKFNKADFKSIGRASYTYSNGIYTITPNGTNNVSLQLNIDLPAGTYTYQGYAQGTTQIRNSSHTVIANNININHTFTISEDGIEIVFNWGTGTSTDVFTVDMNDIQIEQGSEQTSYEEFTGGQPSPSPDYPQDIYVVSGDNEIKFEGKNLFDKSTKVNNYYIDASGNITANTGFAYSALIPVEQTNYILKGKTYETSTKRIHGYNSDGVWVKQITYEQITANNDYSIPITINDSNIKYIRISIKIADTNVKIIKNSEIEDYPISLGDLEYCKIGDYEDLFFKNVVGSEYYDSTLELNKWYLKKNIEKINTKITFNSTGFTNLFSSQSTLFKFKYVTQQAFLNYFKNVVNTNIINNSTANGNLQNNEFCFRWADNIENKDRLYVKTNLTLEQLDDLMILLYYVSNTPTNILLNDTLQTQLDNIQKATTYQDQTNVSQTNADLPFVIKMSAIRDLSNIFSLIQ